MRGMLDVVGALTLAGGLLTGIIVHMENNLLPAWVPWIYILGGLLGSLMWFALSSIIRRLDDIQVMVGKPSP